MRRLRRLRAQSDRGALLAEFAIVVPLLALVSVGVFEFGLAWRDDLSVANAGRAGARTASSAGDDRLADYDALQSIRGAISSINSAELDYVVVYESSTADGAPSPSCAGGVASATPGGRCNVYSAAEMNSLTPADFAGATDCAGDPDETYCPLTDRETDFDIGPDYVGVYLRVRRDFISGVFPGSITITDHTVMRLEAELS